MSRFIEPRGWDDMTQEKKESIVTNLISVGMLSLEVEESSNDILEKMRRGDEGSLGYMQAKNILQNRGLENVAKGIENKLQAMTLVKVFGDEVSRSIPVEALNRRPSQRTGEQGLAR